MGDNRRSWNPDYWQLGEASVGKWATTGDPGTQGLDKSRQVLAFGRRQEILERRLLAAGLDRSRKVEASGRRLEILERMAICGWSFGLGKSTQVGDDGKFWNACYWQLG